MTIIKASTFIRLVAFGIVGVAVGVMGALAPSNGTSAQVGLLPSARAICASTPGALASVGPDLIRDALPDASCHDQVPAAALADFNPGYHHETAVVQHSSRDAEPPIAVSVMVVSRESRAYEMAALTDFIVDSRYFCERNHCWPTGYEVYITPDEVGTSRVDELVALAYGVPRDPCAPLIPDWIQRRFACGDD